MEVIFRFYFGGHFPLKILPKNIWRSFSGFAFEQNSYGGHFPIFVWGSFSCGGHFPVYIFRCTKMVFYLQKLFESAMADSHYYKNT